jgi:hypothetical protein
MSDNISPTEPFPLHVKRAFMDVILSDDYVNRERMSHDKFVRIQVFLDNPQTKPIDGSDSKVKFDALKFYELNNRILYRSPSGKYTTPRKVLTSNTSWDVYIEAHLRLGHPGRDALYAELEPNFYGISRKECEWIKAQCVICILSASNHSKAAL